MTVGQISKTIEHTAETDHTIRFLISRKNLGTGAKEPVDLTGAYVYFSVLQSESDSTELLDKNNDAGSGVTIDPDQVTNRGIVDVKIEHTDFASDAPSRKMIYGLLLRLDPGGDDDRFDAARGQFVLRANRITV